MTYKDKKAKATELGLEFSGSIKGDDLDALLATVGVKVTETEVEVVEKDEIVIKKVTAPKAKQRHELTRGEKARLVKADLMRKERVIVIDRQTQYQVDDAEPVPVRVSFRLGQIRDARMVQMDQEPQFLTRGIIQVMNDMLMDSTYQIPGKYTKDSVVRDGKSRFIITPAPDMTEDEIINQKARENARSK